MDPSVHDSRRRINLRILRRLLQCGHDRAGIVSIDHRLPQCIAALSAALADALKTHQSFVSGRAGTRNTTPISFADRAPFQRYNPLAPEVLLQRCFIVARVAFPSRANPLRDIHYGLHIRFLAAPCLEVRFTTTHSPDNHVIYTTPFPRVPSVG